MTGQLYRTAALEVSADKAVDSVCFATEPAAVPRLDRNGKQFFEHIDTRASEFSSFMAFNFDHEPSKLAGEVPAGSARCDVDGKCRCSLRWYPENEQIRAEFLDGIRPNSFSCEYDWLRETRRETRADGEHRWYACKFFAVSALLTLEPADRKAGLYRSFNMNLSDSILSLALQDAITGHRHRFDTFPEKDCARVDVTKIFRAALGQGKLDGIEAEMNAEGTQRCGNRFSGIFLPNEVINHWTRDMTVSSFSQGGAFVPTPVQADPIPVYLSKRIFGQRGVTFIDGATQNITWPREVDPPTVSMTSETGQANPSTPVFDDVVWRPHRATAGMVIGEQWLLMAGADANRFALSRIGRKVAQVMEYQALNGQGAANEVLGLINQVGVASVLFGASATWAKVLEFLGNITSANADQPGASLGWATTGTVKKKWLQIPKIAASTNPVFLWEDRMAPGDDGRVCDYGASVTNNVLSDRVMFGDWADLVVVQFFGGVFLTADKFTSAGQGKVNVYAHSYFDSNPLHPWGWCVSADSGAQ